ncbi:MAG: cytochrome P450 [Actinobacteria bacterium]|nr:cytochrome P450 [Actinomycetota bacterium]
MQTDGASTTPDRETVPGLEAFSTHETSPGAAYAAYERMRDQCPVSQSTAHGGYHILTRYDDVRAAARDWEKFSSAQGVNLPRTPLAGQLPALEHDPPTHRAWRELFQRVLNPKTINRLQPRAEAFAGELIDGFIGAGVCDLTVQYTEQLPPMVVSEAVGFDVDRAHEMREISMALASSVGEEEEEAAQFGKFASFVLSERRTREERPGEDFLSFLANEEIEGLGRVVTDQEFIGCMAGFFIAGHETTTAALSTALAYALPRSDWVDGARRDPKVMSSLIEEALRYSCPFHSFHRTATGDVEVRGVAIPEGGDVMLNWAAANRDPEVFDEPNEFRLDRAQNHHVTFGFGIHACVGAALSRMEMRAALRVLFERIPDIQLVSETPPNPDFCGGIVALIPSLPATFSPRP